MARRKKRALATKDDASLVPRLRAAVKVVDEAIDKLAQRKAAARRRRASS